MQGTNQKQKGSKTDCCSIRKHWLSIDYHQKKSRQKKINENKKQTVPCTLFFSLVSFYIYFFIPFFLFHSLIRKYKGEKMLPNKIKQQQDANFGKPNTHIFFTICNRCCYFYGWFWLFGCCCLDNQVVIHLSLIIFSIKNENTPEKRFQIVVFKSTNFDPLNFIY